MQIFELTQSRKSRLNEYDPDRSPDEPNYGTGVGPGVQPQYTATPRMKTAPQPGPAPQLPPPNTTTGAVTPVAPSPELQTIDAPPQLTGPAATKQIGTNYDPNVIDVDAKVVPNSTQSPAPAPNYSAGNYNQTSNAPTASVPATNTAMPANMSTTGAPAPDVVDPTLAAASKVGMTAAKPPGVDVGGAIARALMKHNAGKAGLGYLLPKDPNTEVYVDRTGRITVGGQPYNAKNPVHQRAAGNITISGQPYNPDIPGHRAAYLAFKNNAGRGGGGAIKIDQNGVVTVNDQPFDPSNPTHIAAWQQRQQGSPVRATPPAAQPAPQQSATQQRPAASAQTTQSPANTAAPTTESLTWSRDFDPSQTLLKKMKSQ